MKGRFLVDLEDLLEDERQKAMQAQATKEREEWLIKHGTYVTLHRDNKWALYIGRNWFLVILLITVTHLLYIACIKRL